MSRLNEYDYLQKFLILGNSAVGKSSLVARYTDDTFYSDFLTTIGVDFRTKTLMVEENIVKIQIWDTAGQERYRTIVGTYYRGAKCMIVTFDITDVQSFKDVDYWLKEINRFRSQEDTLLVLVGTKQDLAAQRKVTVKEAEKLAEINQMVYYEVSAKTGYGVADMFQELCKEVLCRIKIKELPAEKDKNPPQLLEKQEKCFKFSSCC